MSVSITLITLNQSLLKSSRRPVNHYSACFIPSTFLSFGIVPLNKLGETKHPKHLRLRSIKPRSIDHSKKSSNREIWEKKIRPTEPKSILVTRKEGENTAQEKDNHVQLYTRLPTRRVTSSPSVMPVQSTKTRRLRHAGEPREKLVVQIWMLSGGWFSRIIVPKTQHSQAVPVKLANIVKIGVEPLA